MSNIGQLPGGEHGFEAKETKQAGDELAFPGLPLGEAWGESITTPRAAALALRLQAWEQEADHGKRTGPFEDATLTGADVFWLAAQTLAGTRQPRAVAAAAGRLLHTHTRPLRSPPMFSALTLSGADLSSADLSNANLSGADLSDAIVSEGNLFEANLSGATLRRANLSGTILSLANLADARLGDANLSEADLLVANLSGTQLGSATLAGADLRGAHLNLDTGLTGVTLSSTTRLADVIWNAAPLAQVVWDQLHVVGDETLARTRHDATGKQKDAATRLADYEAAVRAYRLLAVALRSQGLNEHADRYAYRAQLMQRVVWRRQRHYLRYLGSLFLDLISGYGYRPLRSILTYIFVVTLFGLTYWALGVQTGHTLTWNEAGVVSLTAFHGRGFFATAFQPGDPQAAVAAIEAVFGLLVEITFIATFTNRFFTR